MSKSCTLSILVAVTDIKFIPHTLPHIVRGCGAFSFDERVLFVDTAPLSGVYRNRPGIGTLDELYALANGMVDDGLFDRVQPIVYNDDEIDRLYRRHFSRHPRFTHNFRGYPIYGSIFSIENCRSDYVLHFDSDMLLHCPPGMDWIADGIDLYERVPEILFLAPRPGPPAATGELQQRGVQYERDDRGFFSFKTFSSRKYLVSKERLADWLPIDPQWISTRRRLASWFNGKSALWNWEIMVSRGLQASARVRADMSSDSPWTLHTPDHGPRFIENLPAIIERVEAGDYPPAQGGNYDLDLDLWLDPAGRG